jgi:predicted amidohydrolase YtcJ
MIAGCDKPQPTAPTPPQAQIDAAEIIYVGGDIVTINDRQPSAEALAVKGGKILAVGARADVEKAHKGASTQVDWE